MSTENEKSSVRKAASEFDKDVTHIDDAAANVKLANPLAGIPHEQLMADAAKFAKEHNLGHLEEDFKKGALVAQDPTLFETLPLLTEEDKAVLRRELTHRWDQPWELYWLVILCSLSAAVQGVSLRANSIRRYRKSDPITIDRWMNPLSTARTFSSRIRFT